MNCHEARLRLGAEPHGTSPELEAHLRTCPACASFRAEMQELDARISRALQSGPLANSLSTASPTETVPQGPKPAAVGPAPEPQPGHRADAADPTVASAEVPSIAGARLRQTGERAGRRARTVPRPAWALAASVLLLLVSAATVWMLRPQNSLAHDVVAHVAGEPRSWESTQPVDAHSLDHVLRSAGINSRITSSEVRYARTCLFRGHFVPHLVIQTAGGPVTVLMLTDEHIGSRREFHDSGYSGVIVPAAWGSLAVLSRGSLDVEGVLSQVSSELAPAHR